MRTVSAAFAARTEASMRPITARVLFSFTKAFDDSVEFFTIGTSTIGGTDILKGDNSIVQEWDKYDYDDYSERLLSVEVNRETEQPTSPVTMATATIVMDNHDDLFTPGNTSSPLNGYIIPRRPVRINAGFAGETVPKFIGITEGKPEIDERNKTATFHCVDFMGFIANVSLAEEVILVNYRTDQIVQAILEAGGMVASQMSLDTGAVIIPFAYFKKDSKIGDALRDVAQAELGNVRMGEAGTVYFSNRQNWNNHTSVYTFDKDNMLERNPRAVDTIINVGEVYSNARAVQVLQPIWQGNGPIEFSDGSVTLAPGETKSVFADFRDDFGELPVTSVEDPEPISVATSSFFQAHANPDGSGTDLTADIDLDSSDLFSTAMKLTFTNTGSFAASLTRLELQGTPARVIDQIYKRTVDAASVALNEEHPYKIENDLIQDATAAATIGQLLVADRADDDNQERWIVKSVPHLQVGDVVTYGETGQDYFVTRVNDIINTSGYRQVLNVGKRTINTYFRIGISTIGGSEPLGP